MAYALKKYLEYRSRLGHLSRIEIHERNYVGSASQMTGSAEPFVYELQGDDEGAYWMIRGSNVSLNLKSLTEGEYKEFATSDDRKYLLKKFEDGVLTWSGYVLNDTYSEDYDNPPYDVTLDATDGLGSLKDRDISDNAGNPLTGLISLKDAVVMILNKCGLDFNVRIAINIYEETMANKSTADCPFEQLEVNSETFYQEKKGEWQARNCYECLERILKPFGAFVIQQGGYWWIAQVNELSGSTVYYREFDTTGAKVTSGSFNPRVNFASKGLFNGLLETMKPHKKLTTSLNYGDLIVNTGNFIHHGDFSAQAWDTEEFLYEILPGLSITRYYYELKDWIYYNCDKTTASARTEDVGGEKNIYLWLDGRHRSFSEDLAYVKSKPVPIKQEAGNVVGLYFKCMATVTEKSEKNYIDREAYFPVALKIGSKWLSFDETTEEYSWSDTQQILKWKISNINQWNEISVNTLTIPENGNVELYLYRCVQPGADGKIRFEVNYDNVRLELQENEELLFKKQYFKTEATSVNFDIEADEVELELGDAKTTMSLGALIYNNTVTSNWHRRGVSESLSLPHLLGQNMANILCRDAYRLTGSTRTNFSPLNVYQEPNEPGRWFLPVGATFNDKSGIWDLDLVEISPVDVVTTQRNVLVLSSAGSSGKSGQGIVGNQTQFFEYDDDGNIYIYNDLLVQGDVKAFSAGISPGGTWWDELANYVDGSTIQYNGTNSQLEAIGLKDWSVLANVVDGVTIGWNASGYLEVLGSLGGGLWTEGTLGEIYYEVGNVGIGTPAPGANLHIHNPSWHTRLRMSQDTKDWVIQINKDTGNLQFLHEITEEVMSFTGSGNVGIGTSSPAAKLDVAGFTRTTSDASVPTSGKGLETFYSTAGDFGGMQAYDRVTGDWKKIRINQFLWIDGNQKVGIGTSDPVLPLDVRGRVFVQVADTPLTLDRTSTNGTLISLRQDGIQEGEIRVFGSTVSFLGFSGSHESSGIQTSTKKGTVLSTIDELDTKNVSGETINREDHAKVKISDKISDKRVYGVVQDFNEDGKVIVTSTGIGSILVSGPCEGGDLLESNGDGTARVQADDIIRSSTIAKVTIGNSDEGVKLVSCIMML